MPTPGSPHALVLPSALSAPGSEVDSGTRAVQLLAPYHDSSTYAALAVIHGQGKRAPMAFDLAKQRLTVGRGVIWLPDPDLLDVLAGEKAQVQAWRKMLKPRADMLVTFVSTAKASVVSGLAWYEVSSLEIDRGYLAASK